MEKSEEIWKDIENSNGLYRISNLGNVFSVGGNPILGSYKQSRILKPSKTKRGYLQVKVLINGIRVRVYVHRLVGLAFVLNPQNKPYINHLDENPENNRWDNLEWSTQKENVNYSLNLHGGQLGDKNSMFGRIGENSGYTKKVVDSLTGEIFPTVLSASTHLKISRKHLINQLKNKIPNTCGLKYCD